MREEINKNPNSEKSKKLEREKYIKVETFSDIVT